MASHSDFFGERNSQTVLKHGVLTRYAHYFAGRAGRATVGRVAFIDGYAGAGRYDDGSPGSPLLLASEAKRAEAMGRNVKLAFVEPDQRIRRRLERSLGEADIRPNSLVSKPFDTALEGLLEQFADHALLVFVDPFGLAVDQATLLRLFGKSTRRQPIDVLYHFSLSTVARMGRAGISDIETAAHNALRLDEALGSVNWREEFAGSDERGKSTEAAMAVARRFSASVTAESDFASTSIPVRQRPGQLPKYLLILFSKDPQAHWDFADQASMAYVDWLHHCDTIDYQANLQAREASGIQTLFEDPAPDRSNVEALLESEAIGYLTTRVVDIIHRHRRIRLIDRIEDVYGEMLGRARIRHLRKAIRALHTEGLIDDNGVGDFHCRNIQWIE
ncbi:MAG: three-Cys-motif partner protein TcmP [Acidimicrobiia bacterium]|nr:three-Cys-motif partner protein TcmP [Acidimicrobiia bacterium]MCY4434184.1 three-Cys-motif partner protein TcmP [bacterium]